MANNYTPGKGPLPGTVTPPQNRTHNPMGDNPAQRALNKRNLPINTKPSKAINPIGRPGPGRQVATPPKPAVSQGGRDDSNAVKTAKQKVSKDTGPSVPSTPSSTDLSVPDVATGNGNTIPTVGYGKLGNGTAQAMAFDPAQYASSMAGMKYDPAITLMAGRIQGIINALPGSLDSLHKAFANLDAYKNAPPTQPVVGGPTTTAGDTFAAQTASINDAGTAALARSAAGREADWTAKLGAMSRAQQFDLGNQLSALQAAKGDAQTGFMQQGLQTKSDLVKQAILNVNSIRASNDAQSLAQGMVTHQNLVNKGLGETVKTQKIANKYTPIAEALNLKGQAQNIALTGIKLKQATTDLKKISGPKTLLNAVSNGGPTVMSALTGQIIPSNGIVVDPNDKNKSTVYGNPNTWMKSGIRNIQRLLPQSDPGNVAKFVHDQIATAVSAAHSWNWDQSKGKWIQKK